MKKYWICGVVAIVAAAAVFAADQDDERTSENLLGKAQSEFTAQARNAMIQRQMVNAPAPATITKVSVAPVLETVSFTTTGVAEPPRKRAMTAQDLEALRARSPELAAAMARYM